jgi:DNA-binding NarL/FixJ family response regulator
MRRETVRIPATPPVPRLRIALVEDKALVRDSWSKLINSFSDFSCDCVCSSGEEALRTIPAFQPDAVLMDIFLPRMSGIECTARLKELLPKTRVVMLTAVDDNELVFMALQAGADGFLLKRTKPADLRAALLEVTRGGAPMTSEIARRVVESFRRPPKSREQTVHLTTREEEVLILLSKGYSNKEIADQLSLGVETIGSHLKHIYEKMHVRSRTEAMAQYMTAKS